MKKLLFLKSRNIKNSFHTEALPKSKISKQ